MGIVQAGFTKRAGIAALACGAIGLTLAGCSSNSEGPSPSTPSVKVPTSEPASPSTTAGGSDIGKPITVGSATYTVESVKNIGKDLTSPEGESQAQGAFIIIKMNVANTGSSTLTVDPANFTAVAGNGQSVQADFNDSLIANGKDTVLTAGIPAGKTSPVSLAFDFSPAPKAPITQLVIKEPGTSNTVTVKLA